MRCENCQTQILPHCGYEITALATGNTTYACTVACGAEYLGKRNLQMQSVFANDTEVDLRERGEEDA